MKSLLVKKNSLHTSLTAQNSEQLVASHSHTKTQRVLFVWALDEAHTHNQILAQFRVAENLDCAGPPAEPPKS
jgi:cephalosporin hydroxylase